MTDTIHINLWHGDCKQRLQELADDSVDLALCDPPYGLEFMGKEWDKLDLKGDMTRPDSSESSRQRAVRGMEHGIHAGKPAFNLTRESQHAMQKWHGEWLIEVFRVLKPGCWAKVFSATRTFHRVCAAMEEAGFEGVKDNLEAWTYGSGFPKSLNISKALDKMAGRAKESTERLKRKLIEACDASGKTRIQIDDECGFRATNYLTLPKKRKRPDPWVHVLPSEEKWERMKQVLGCGDSLDEYFREAQRQVVGTVTKARNTEQGVPLPGGGAETEYKTWDLTISASDLAKKWEGYGTALKPAWEPIVCGRKPG